MTRPFWLLLAIVAGSAFGLALTYLAVHSPPNFGVVVTGPWVIRPGSGSTNADPYSKALMASRGEVPLGASEGVTLVATADSSGRPLNQRCTYTFEGTVPAANYWTLTVHNRAGAPASTSQRSVYTSSETLMTEQGVATISVSPQPHPGNWLPLTGTGAFELYLRLYETQISSSAAALDRGVTPELRRERCS